MTSKTLAKAKRALAKRARQLRTDREKRNHARALEVLADLVTIARHLERTGRVQR